jgi:plasmid stabilization system protein ParE
LSGFTKNGFAGASETSGRRLFTEAQVDLRAIYGGIADATSEDVAIGYVRRVRACLDGFDIASERGTSRDDLRPGLRVIGFERRLRIWFRIAEHEVRILRIFRAGQDWASEL